MRGNKFFAKKVKVGDMTFDSKREYERYKSFGDNLIDRQVRFELLPKHKCLLDLKAERPLYYTCDYVYLEGDTLVVEDVKSDYTRKEKDYIIRRKLFKYVYLNSNDTEFKKLHERFPEVSFKNARFNEWY